MNEDNKLIEWTESAISCYRKGCVQLSVFQKYSGVRYGDEFKADCLSCDVPKQGYNFKCKMDQQVQAILNQLGKPREGRHLGDTVYIGNSDITHAPFHWKVFALIYNNPGIGFGGIMKALNATRKKVESAVFMGLRKGCIVGEKQTKEGSMRGCNAYYFNCDNTDCVKRDEFNSAKIIELLDA